jgi:hypothetical protein
VRAKTIAFGLAGPFEVLRNIKADPSAELRVTPRDSKREGPPQSQKIPGHVLVCGLVDRESSWNTYAIRSERGFWARYGKSYRDHFPKEVWLRYPEIFSASYGLMQVMYPVALELGAKLRFPTELCDPELGIEWGCRILRKKLDVAKGNIMKALQFYNGGGNKNYASEVLELAKKYEGIS